MFKISLHYCEFWTGFVRSSTGPVRVSSVDDFSTQDTSLEQICLLLHIIESRFIYLLINKKLIKGNVGRSTSIYTNAFHISTYQHRLDTTTKNYQLQQRF
jgi:hypothetical protein